MSVYTSTRAQLESWGVEGSPDGEILLVLAAALDDRAGVQNLAATAKRLQESLAELRDKFEPKKGGRLSVLRGGAGSEVG